MLAHKIESDKTCSIKAGHKGIPLAEAHIDVASSAQPRKLIERQ